MKSIICLCVFVVSAGLAPLAHAQARGEIGNECEQWNPLGVGVYLFAHSLTEFDGDLIVGGAFTHAGGQLVNRIAKWTGSTWHALGSGMNHDVKKPPAGPDLGPDEEPVRRILERFPLIHSEYSK